MIHEKVITKLDTWCLFQCNRLALASNIAKLFVSMCNIDNSDQLIEIYFLDKSIQLTAYYQLITELEQSPNLSVMLVGSNTLVGYRSNYHQLTNALNMNRSLEYVTLRYCLISDDIGNILSSYFLNYHCLKHLVITNCNMRNCLSSLMAVLQALKENCKLKVLNLNHNNMTGEVSESLASVIKNNSGLEELGLSDNDLKASSAVILQALKGSCKLKAINLNNNNTTGEVAEDLASVIKNNSSLEELGLSCNDLKLSSVVILQALKENCKLKTLNLNCNHMTAEVAEHLVNVIKNNKSLKRLYLFNNDLKTSAIGILQALKANHKLRVLDLSSNNTTGQVAKDLASVIKNNCNIEQLGLANNNLKLSSAVIFQALKEIHRLKFLHLSSNNMTGEVVEDLVSVIKNNPDLEELYLSDNDLNASAGIILQALAENCKLKVLDLNNNNMTGEVAEDLANVIKNNFNLEQLGLANNNLELSAVVILHAIKDNCKLKVLNLNGNNMPGEVVDALVSVIKNNVGLEEIYLSHNDLKTFSAVILKALTNHSVLRKLHLNDSLMGEEVTECVAGIINNNSSLEFLCIDNSKLPVVILQEDCKLEGLNLSINNMTEKVAEDLAIIIKNNLSLKEIYVSCRDLKSSAGIILKLLKENSKLKVLNLNSSIITGYAVEDLASIIKNNLDLEQLHLSDNDLKTSAVEILQALEENCKLKVLNLNSNNMTGEVAEYLASIMKNNPDLEQVYLSDNNLKSSAATVLKALKQNSELEVLALSNNDITGRVAEDLANFIKNNSNLKQLGLKNNKLGSSSVLILQALKANTKLETLNLSGTNIKGQVAEDIADVIKSNPGLKHLNLCDNILKSSAAVILKALKNNSQLKYLFLSNNYMSNYYSTESPSKELVSVIKNNPLITKLWLGDNMLQNGLIEIAVSCNSLANLQVLELSHNGISPQEVGSLASAVVNITSLQALIFSGLVLSITERLYSGVIQFYKGYQELLFVNNHHDNEKLEIVCLEMWKLRFANKIKILYDFGTINCFSRTIMIMHAIPHYSEENLSTMLSITKHSEQKLSQLNTPNMIIFLSSIIKH